MQYVKAALTFDEQLRLLRDRGMDIHDDAHAMRCLKCVGYYRLMGYFFPFRRTGSDDFHPGTSFEKPVALYMLDGQLRSLVLEAVSHIEVAIRTAVTYEIGHAYGAFGHCDPGNMPLPSAWHEQWLRDLNKEAGRSREAFVTHYKATYAGFPDLPIWMASEVMSLGTMSRLVKRMHHADRKRIAAYFGLPAPVFASWIHAMAVARNICAHHGRLWNKVLGVKPARPKERVWNEAFYPCATDRLFFLLMMLGVLLESTATDAVAWRDRVGRLLKSFLSVGADPLAMGLPTKWDEHPAWTPSVG